MQPRWRAGSPLRVGEHHAELTAHAPHLRLAYDAKVKRSGDTFLYHTLRV